MPELSSLRDQTCIVGIGETAYTRGTPKSASELVLTAALAGSKMPAVHPKPSMR
jgi:hypothetical protein